MHGPLSSLWSHKANCLRTYFRATLYYFEPITVLFSTKAIETTDNCGYLEVQSFVCSVDNMRNIPWAWIKLHCSVSQVVQFVNDSEFGSQGWSPGTFVTCVSKKSQGRMMGLSQKPAQILCRLD